MALTIIVRSKLKSRGRSDYERILRDEGWGGGLTEEEADKCNFLERQAKKSGIDKPTFFRGTQINRIK